MARIRPAQLHEKRFTGERQEEKEEEEGDKEEGARGVGSLLFIRVVT